MKVKYYLEKLRNIKSLSIVLVVDDSEDGEDEGARYTFEVRSDRDSVGFRIRNARSEREESFRVTLPNRCKIDPASLHIQQNPELSSKYIEIKAKLSIDASEPDYELSENDVINDHHLISLDTTEAMKQHFNAAEKGSVYCRTCLANILNYGETETKVKLLPSSNWVELMDVWLCGCTGVSNFVDLPSGEINATKDCYFIGDQFVLVHRDNTVGSALTEEQSRRVNIGSDHSNYWNLVQCAYCESTLGLHQAQENLSFNYRFYKHQISSSPRPPLSYTHYNLTNPDNIYHQYSLETFLSTKILLESRGSMQFNFFLASITNHQIFAMISLIHWETLLLTNHFSDNPSQTEFKPILKILYYKIDYDEPTDHSHNPLKKENELKILKKWNTEFQSKYLYFQPEECHSILNLLDSSNLLFPSNRNILNLQNLNFNLGVLRLKI